MIETIAVSGIDYHLFQHTGKEARRVCWQLGPDYFIVVKLFDGPQIQTIKFWHTAISISDTANHWSMAKGVNDAEEAKALVKKAVDVYNAFLNDVTSFPKHVSSE